MSHSIYGPFSRNSTVAPYLELCLSWPKEGTQNSSDIAAAGRKFQNLGPFNLASHVTAAFFVEGVLVSREPRKTKETDPLMMDIGFVKQKTDCLMPRHSFRAVTSSDNLLRSSKNPKPAEASKVSEDNFFKLLCLGCTEALLIYQPLAAQLPIQWVAVPGSLYTTYIIDNPGP